jgi:chloramphenicol O-acetyltransferase type A
VAAHQVENFRTRIVDGTVWLYEEVNGGSAVGRPNGTLGSLIIAIEKATKNS